MTWVYLYAVAVLLISGPGLLGTVRRLIRIYGCYFLVAFVMRSTLLAILEPVPQENSSFAISELAYRGYDDSLNALLPYVCTASLALYASAFVGQRLFLRSPVELKFSVLPSVAAAVYVSGVLLRAGAVILPDSALFARMGSLGQGISAGILAAFILGTDWRKSAPRLALALCALECLTSFPLVSKTPLLTVLLLLYLDPRRPKLHVRTISMAFLAIVFAFTGLQALKPQANAIQGDNWLEMTFFSLTGRLDGLYAMSEAWASGPASYIPERGVLRAVANGLVPGWLQDGDKLLAGRLWGINIYGADTGVSYAEGLSAEGYVMLGDWGPAIWGVLGGLVFAAVGWAIQSGNRYLQLVAFSLLASTVMFERGILGQIEQLGSVLQSSVVAIVGLVVFQNIQKSRRQSTEFISFAKS